MSDTKRGKAKVAAEPKKRGRRSMFTDEQRKILMKYYDNGMKSTNRQHIDTIEKCAKECQTSVERIKRFIGAENYKRKKAGDSEVVEEPPPPEPRKRKISLQRKAKQKRGKKREDDDEEDDDENKD